MGGRGYHNKFQSYLDTIGGQSHFSFNRILGPEFRHLSPKSLHGMATRAQLQSQNQTAMIMLLGSRREIEGDCGLRGDTDPEETGWQHRTGDHQLYKVAFTAFWQYGKTDSCTTMLHINTSRGWVGEGVAKCRCGCRCVCRFSLLCQSFFCLHLVCHAIPRLTNSTGTELNWHTPNSIFPLIWQS